MQEHFREAEPGSNVVHGREYPHSVTAERLSLTLFFRSYALHPKDSLYQTDCCLITSPCESFTDTI